MKKFSRVYAEIKLDAIEENFLLIQKNLNPKTKVVAVVKADAYGHGAVPIANMLQPKEYIWGFAVATVEEAEELCNHNITKPILILGYVFPENYDILVQHQIRTTVFKRDMAEKLSNAAVKSGKTLPIHLAVDTGMTRIGFEDCPDSVETIKEIVSLPGIIIEGIFTHFARADEKDKTFTKQQYQRYISFLNALEEAGIHAAIRHCGNSAAILEMPETGLELMRSGIINYGIYPSNEMDRTKLILKPAMSLISHITFIKKVPPGTPVSYGGTYITNRFSRIATIPVGYADGYPRSLSNKGFVLIHGKKAPILGRICMDQFMVDITDIPQACESDEVVLLGKSQNVEITIDELGNLSNRFPYEFVCNIGKRVPRIFTQKGQILLSQENI